MRRLVPLLLLLLVTAGAVSAEPVRVVVAVYVAVDGRDDADGSKAHPLATLQAAREAVRKLKADAGGKMPPGGITVYLRGGRYPLHTFILGRADSGAPGAPVTYRAAPGETVVLDGGLAIPASAFKPVVDHDKKLLARLHPAARGRAVVADLRARGMVTQIVSWRQISVDGRMMRLSRWPNKGFAHIGTVHDVGAVYAHGRTPGMPPTFSMAKPIGGTFTPLEPLSDLAPAEFARTRDVRVEGFLAYDWHKTTHSVARITARRIQLLNYHRYGVGKSYEKTPRRIRLYNLLCELDQPGEWHCDPADGLLYLWPHKPIRPDTAIAIGENPCLIELRRVSHVVLRDLHFESARWQPIVVTGGSDNLIAGCTIRNCGRGVIITGGTNNGVTGCDIIDVGGHHIELRGGDRKTLTPAGNFATNNHLTQTAHEGERGVRIRGVGNIFANNLLHDFVGQGIVYEGNGHLIERNEIYNVGIEEGDGGATYCGAQLWSYGNVIRHNFIHHLLCVPGAHPRGGVYLDDLDAGDTVYGNVFYKAAHRAVLVNGGPANVVANNIFLSGYIGIYSTGVYAAKARDYAKRYDAGQLKRGDKMDYLWRCEQVVGKGGWNRPPWSVKYPLFRKVMAGDFYNPIECRFTNNYFHGNAKQDVWLNKVPDGTIEVRGHRPITPAAFVAPESLDFRFKATFKPHRDFKPIPFESAADTVATSQTHALY